MPANNQARFVQISNFRNIGIGSKPQVVCLNRSVDDQYIGNLVLLIGPNNGGKSNLLAAFNLLNENQSFNYNDLPHAIKNKNERTAIKLFNKPIFNIDTSEYEDEEEEIITKFTNGEKNPPRETFSEWKEGVRRWIESMLDKYMQHYGYKDQLQFIASGIPRIYWNNQEYALVSNFFLAIDNWTFEEFIKSKWWEKDLGKIEFKSRTPYFNNNIGTAYETILNQELIDYLNKLIELDNQTNYALLSHSSKTFNIRFYKYEPWKIDNSFFKAKYKGQWNEFFTNLFNKLGINQQDIIHGIWGKQRYYEQIVKDGLKKISDYFNSIFMTSDYLYEFALFFNEESISFEINLVKQDDTNPDANKIIPCIFDEQSTAFQYFFNLYFGLLIGKTNQLRRGDVILMDEPIGNLQVAGLIQLHDILKKFTIDTGISIVMCTQSPFLIDFDYLDEVRFVDFIDGMVKITNNFVFNKKPISKSLKSILHGLVTYPNFLFKYHHPIFVLVQSMSEYNYLTGYKLYKIKQLEKEMMVASTSQKVSLKQLLHTYQALTFIPIHDLKENHDNLESLFEQIDEEDEQTTKIFLITKDEENQSVKDLNFKQIIAYPELIPNLKDANKDLGIESLISDNDKDAYSLNKDGPDAYLNNTVTFKYAMINDQVSKQTYQDLECLFANLIKKLTNK